MKKMLLLLLAVALAGCTTRTLEFPNGVKYKSTSFLTNPTIGPVTMSGSKDGYTDFKMGGYSHSQTQILQTIEKLAALAGAPAP
jgi:hypothetical protein